MNTTECMHQLKPMSSIRFKSHDALSVMTNPLVPVPAWSLFSTSSTSLRFRMVFVLLFLLFLLFFSPAHRLISATSSAVATSIDRVDRSPDMKLSKFAKHSLTFPGPSPIQHLERLSKTLGNNVQLYAKHEDCNSGLAFGGNKTRKLEYMMPDAIQGGTTRSCPSVAFSPTRHVRWLQWPVGNIQLSRILEADGRRHAAGFDIGIRPSWEAALEDVKKAGGKPYAIPAGCPEHPKGGVGFVEFAEEVRQQEHELGFQFDYIVVCAVTGSNMAGMVVGFAFDGRASKVIGIDASATPTTTRAQVLRIAKQMAELVELDREITAQDIVLDTRFGGPEYGLPNQGTLQAIRLCARTEGMLTDPVYEGKSMDGMISMVRNGEFPNGSKVLYAHLGGAPALSAYSYLFQEG